MTGERIVTISFKCTGLQAAHLEDAIDDFYEANEVFEEWVETGGLLTDTTSGVRLAFFSEYLGNLAGAALAQKRLGYQIKKEE